MANFLVGDSQGMKVLFMLKVGVQVVDLNVLFMILNGLTLD